MSNLEIATATVETENSYNPKALDKLPTETLTVTPLEKKLLAVFLGELMVHYSNAGCNDFNYEPFTTKERKILSKWVVDEEGNDCSGLDIEVLCALVDRLNLDAPKA